MSNSEDNVIKVDFKPTLTEKLTDDILATILSHSKELTFFEAIGIIETVKQELFALSDNDGGDSAS
jgi:hypothetical protein